MRVTVAVDDISLPLPPMATPDIRQSVLEIVLDMLAGHGVDDVHIIIANSLHRKMTEWEMKRMVGKKIFDVCPRTRNSIGRVSGLMMWPG